MAKEFSDFIEIYRKAPIKEKLDGLCDIVEKMMKIIILIPESIDKSILNINNILSNMETRIDGLESHIKYLKYDKNTKPNNNKILKVAKKPEPKVNLRENIMSELKILFNKRR